MIKLSQSLNNSTAVSISHVAHVSTALNSNISLLRLHTIYIVYYDITLLSNISNSIMAAQSSYGISFYITHYILLYEHYVTVMLRVEEDDFVLQGRTVGSSEANKYKQSD